MDFMAVLLGGTWLVGFFLYARMDKRVKDLTANSNGMSIMLEHVLTEAGIKHEDWGPIMERAIQREVDAKRETL